MSTMWLSAPAKLNLMLHVVGRRADGYHELQTVFQLIDLCDRIEIRVRDDGAIIRPKGPTGVAEAEDLTVRAAKALQKESRHRLGRRNLRKEAHSDGRRAGRRQLGRGDDPGGAEPDVAHGA